VLGLEKLTWYQSWDFEEVRFALIGFSATDLFFTFTSLQEIYFADLAKERVKT
jgi:hypothetical protein